MNLHLFCVAMILSSSLSHSTRLPSTPIVVIEQSPPSPTINTTPTSLSSLKSSLELHYFTSTTTLPTPSSSSFPTVFPFLINLVLSRFENPMSSHSSGLINIHAGGFTSQLLEVPEDDPDQYLNSSILDLVTLSESPEKEAAHNIMAIAAESLMNEGAYLSSEYQGEETPFLGDVRTTVLLESLAHEMFSEKPSEEPDSLPCKPTPAPPDHSKLLESSSKSPTIRSQQQESFESTLQKSRRSVKTRKRRLMNQRKFVTDKSVPVSGIDKNAPKEPGSLVKQSIKAQKSVDKASDETIEKQNGASMKGSNKSKKSPVEQAMSEDDTVGLIS